MSTIPKIAEDDPWLKPYAPIIESRRKAVYKLKDKLVGVSGHLKDFATGYLFYGLHKTPDGWLLREYAPNATSIYIAGDFNNWKEVEEFKMASLKNGDWVQGKLPTVINIS